MEFLECRPGYLSLPYQMHGQKWRLMVMLRKCLKISKNYDYDIMVQPAYDHTAVRRFSSHLNRSQLVGCCSIIHQWLMWGCCIQKAPAQYAVMNLMLYSNLDEWRLGIHTKNMKSVWSVRVQTRRLKDIATLMSDACWMPDCCQRRGAASCTLKMWKLGCPCKHDESVTT